MPSESRGRDERRERRGSLSRSRSGRHRGTLRRAANDIIQRERENQIEKAPTRSLSKKCKKTAKILSGIFVAVGLIFVFYVITTIIIDGSSPFDIFSFTETFGYDQTSSSEVNKIYGTSANISKLKPKQELNIYRNFHLTNNNRSIDKNSVNKTSNVTDAESRSYVAYIPVPLNEEEEEEEYEDYEEESERKRSRRKKKKSRRKYEDHEVEEESDTQSETKNPLFVPVMIMPGANKPKAPASKPPLPPRPIDPYFVNRIGMPHHGPPKPQPFIPQSLPQLPPRPPHRLPPRPPLAPNHRHHPYHRHPLNLHPPPPPPPPPRNIPPYSHPRHLFSTNSPTLVRHSLPMAHNKNRPFLPPPQQTRQHSSKVYSKFPKLIPVTAKTEPFFSHSSFNNIPNYASTPKNLEVIEDHTNKNPTAFMSYNSYTNSQTNFRNLNNFGYKAHEDMNINENIGKNIWKSLIDILGKSSENDAQRNNNYMTTTSRNINVNQWNPSSTLSPEIIPSKYSQNKMPHHEFSYSNYSPSNNQKTEMPRQEYYSDHRILRNRPRTRPPYRRPPPYFRDKLYPKPLEPMSRHYGPLSPQYGPPRRYPRRPPDYRPYRRPFYQRETSLMRTPPPEFKYPSSASSIQDIINYMKEKDRRWRRQDAMNFDIPEGFMVGNQDHIMGHNNFLPNNGFKIGNQNHIVGNNPFGETLSDIRLERPNDVSFGRLPQNVQQSHNILMQSNFQNNNGQGSHNMKFGGGGSIPNGGVSGEITNFNSNGNMFNSHIGNGYENNGGNSFNSNSGSNSANNFNNRPKVTYSIIPPVQNTYNVRGNSGNNNNDDQSYRGKPTAFNIMLDVYPMDEGIDNNRDYQSSYSFNNQRRMDDANKHEVILHLNLFSKKPRHKYSSDMSQYGRSGDGLSLELPLTGKLKPLDIYKAIMEKARQKPKAEAFTQGDDDSNRDLVEVELFDVEEGPILYNALEVALREVNTLLPPEQKFLMEEDKPVSLEDLRHAGKVEGKVRDRNGPGMGQDSEISRPHSGQEYTHPINNNPSVNGEGNDYWDYHNDNNFYFNYYDHNYDHDDSHENQNYTHNHKYDGRHNIHDQTEMDTSTLRPINVEVLTTTLSTIMVTKVDIPENLPTPCAKDTRLHNL